MLNRHAGSTPFRLSNKSLKQENYFDSVSALMPTTRKKPDAKYAYAGMHLERTLKKCTVGYPYTVVQLKNANESFQCASSLKLAVAPRSTKSA